ncbi:unnamed protein product [Polarella glacialis]|uniref:TIR domain-containing protein n=1 Tax=Polarella glacialis TaxID=89957 RepID=A0A813EK71_POLGL|nr:unnamed protein product [Polarella glacialis]CAE8729364.1 unnamed protein product [Polarella glacialis]
MTVAKKDVDEANVAATTEVEEAKDAAREEVETAMAATKHEISNAMVAAQTDVEEAKVAAKKDEAKVGARDEGEAAKVAAKKGVEEAQVAARDAGEAGKTATKLDVTAAMVAAKKNVEEAKDAAKIDAEEAKAEVMAAEKIREARPLAREDNPERRMRRSISSSVGLPPGKKYHYFLSHKKEHSTLGQQPESLAMAIHDSQMLSGFVGFVDVVNLKAITPLQVASEVRKSCAMIVVLHDETCASSWCQFEWKAAELAGVPVLCIVDAHHHCRMTVLEQVKQCSSHLMVHQWVSYIDAYQHDASIKITDWLYEQATRC